MYYLLNERYRLCGWEKLPYAIIDRKYGRAQFVNKFILDTLEMCNGKIDFSIPIITDDQRKLVEQLVKEGVVSECEKGSELKEKQKYIFYNNRYMNTVHWSITGKCNCKCKHCYMSAPDAKYGELTHEQIMKIVNDMGNCGVLRCTLTGGEALVRSDFWDIVDGLLEREILITQIYSNGFLVNEKFLDELEKRGIHPEINMSFDGTGHHDWLRGIPGAEQAVRKAFLLCQKRGFPTGAEMCLWKDNAGSLRESINNLTQMGCRSLKVNPISDTGAWKDGNYGNALSMTEDEVFNVYYEYIDSFYQDLPNILVHLGGFFYADGGEPDFYELPAVHIYENPMRASMCVHARNTMYISAEGRAETCMGMASMSDEFQNQYPLVQEMGLRDCLVDSSYMKLIDTRVEEIIARNEKCIDCKYKSLCLGGCRASAMMFHRDDVLAVDEMTCKIYRDGWLTKIIDKISKLRPEAVCYGVEEYLKVERSDI